MLNTQELARRKPLWSALSELWLDTEIAQHHIERIAQAALASGYSTQQLNEIYLYEVAPVVGGNLLIPAGAWQGFNEDWLHIEARNRADRRGLWLRFWLWSGVGRKLLTYATQSHWEEVLDLVREQQASSAGHEPHS